MRLIMLAVGLAAPPLAGIALSGRDLGAYLEFPPITQATPAPPFSWPVFLGLGVVCVAAVAPFLGRILVTRTSRAERPAPRRPFPTWGWAGIAWLAVAWVVAWTRFPALAPVQEFTFLPLWLGFAVVANALTYRRSGWCPLCAAPGRFALLFPLSALFWWGFELLNRVVRNWHYVGVSEWSPLQYSLVATLSFSTVLPAVLSAFALLSTFPVLARGLDHAPGVRISAPRRWAWVALALSVLALTALGRWPAAAFPFLWLAPLGVLVSLRYLDGASVPFAELADGDWRGVWLAALSALLCGFLWELWNIGSLSKWEYTVPYVQRFHVFEMPVLGYFGYLPFGLVCIAFIDYLGDGYRQLVERSRRAATPRGSGETGCRSRS